MNDEQRKQMLAQPQGMIDCVLDTDTYNEIDDQFALSYILRSSDAVTLKNVYAAPFANARARTPAEGMEKSYDEILRILSLAGAEEMKKNVLRGSEQWLPDEKTPVLSPAAEHLASLAMRYDINHPLYVVAIGAITNVASALLLMPEISERIVVVWLGGHAHTIEKNDEFNLKQDIAAARVVFSSGAPLVQFPCFGVVSELRTTRPELEYWLKGRNALADYLAENTIKEAESYAAGTAWSRVIWDIAPVAWLQDRQGKMFSSKLMATALPTYDQHYDFSPDRPPMRYIRSVDRDRIFTDLFKKLQS